MAREEELTQKAKEVREALIELAADEVDATHIEVGQIKAKDDTRKLLTVRVSGANRYVPYQGHDTSEFTVGDYWAIIFDDYGTIRLGWWVTNNAGGGTIPFRPHDLLDGDAHPDTVAQAVTRGSVIVGDSTPAWNEVVIGAANRIFLSDGADAAWGQADHGAALVGLLDDDHTIYFLADCSRAFGGDPIPDGADTRSLGSAAAEWLNIYVGESGKIYFRLDQSVNLYSSAAGVLKTDDNLHAARVFVGDGLVGSPAYSFQSDVDVGMYRIGVNDLGFTTNSTLALELNASQQALITNGTAAAPGLAFISDPDTGLYRIGANQLGIATAGAFAVAIDAAGNVGIGTATPFIGAIGVDNILTVKSSAYYASVEIASGYADVVGASAVGYLNFVKSSNDVTYRNVASIAVYIPAGGTVNKRGGELRFYTQTDNVAGSTLRMRIDAAGQVIFIGAGGLIFGSCYGNHIGWSQAAAAQNTWYNVSDANMNDGQLHGVTHDGDGLLTVTEPGMYLITYSCCYQDTIANDHLEVGIEINGSGAAQAAGITHSENKFANEEEHLSGCAILDLADNSTIELAIRTTDAGTPTISIQGINLSVVQFGGT